MHKTIEAAQIHYLQANITCPEATDENNVFLLEVKLLAGKTSTLIDNGSTVSLIKNSVVRSDNINDLFVSMCGINDSKLNILGSVVMDIVINNVKFYVVSKNTMKYHCLLGRDFIQRCDL